MDIDKERFNYIDVSRGIVIILMLIGHSGAPSLVVQAIYGFHMPFFFMLSGYLYNYNKYSQLGIKQLIKMKWKVYVVPYFVLSFVNLLVNIPVELVSKFRGGKELLTSTVHHIFWIFYSWGSATRTPNCTPLWFLLCLFIAYIYFYYLLKIKNISLQIVMCFVAVILDVILCKLGIPQLPWHIDIALLGVVFMYVGFKIKELKIMERIEHRMLFIILFLILGFYCIFTNPRIDINPNIINNVVLLYVGSISITFSILLLCKYYVKKCAFLEFLGKNTILIIGFNYAINTYSGVIWNILTSKLNIQVSYTWWMLSIVDIICCLIIIWIWKKIKDKYPKLALF